MSACPIAVSSDLFLATQAVTNAPIVVLDTETTGLNYSTDRIVGVALYVPGQTIGFYLPVYSVAGDDVLSWPDVSALLGEIMNDPNRTVVFHNGQFDLLFLWMQELTANCRIYDTLYAEHRLDNTYPHVNWNGERLNYKLKTLTRRFLGQNQTKFEDVTGGLPAQMVKVAVMAPYAVQDVYYTAQHYQRQLLRLALPTNAGIGNVLFGFDFVLVPMIVNMLGGGIKIDLVKADLATVQDRARFIAAGSKINLAIGRNVDLSKQKKVRKLLREVGLEVTDNTSLSKDRLVELVKDKSLKARRLVRWMLYRRQLADRISKFLVPLAARTHPASGVLYIGGFMSMTATGRFSSKGPNIQALPKGKKGRSLVRQLVLPGEGRTIVAADFKNIEPRCLAQALRMFIADQGQHLAQGKAEARHAASSRFGHLLETRQFIHIYKPKEPPPRPTVSALAEFFLNPGAEIDPYRFIASQAFGIPNPSKADRDRMKTIFLGMVYGRGIGSLMGQLKVDMDVAANYLDLFSAVMPELGVPTYEKDFAGRWRKRRPQMITYKDEIWEGLRHSGEVVSLFGRRRRFPGLYHLRRCDRCLVITQQAGVEYEWEVAPVRLWNYTLHAYVYRVRNRKTGMLLATTNQKLSLPALRDRLTRWPFHQIPYRSIRLIETADEVVEFMPVEDAQREGFNAVIQATAGDVFKMAILRMQPVMHHFDARMLFNVHDELVFSVPNQHLNQFVPAMVQAMTTPPATWWEIPIAVDVEVGPNYGQLSHFELTD